MVLTAAVLLSLPAQAQVARKATKGQTKKFRTERIDDRALQRAKAAKLKAEEAAVQGIAFRGQATAAQPAPLSLEAEQALKAADQTVGKPFAKWNWNSQSAPAFVSKSGLLKNTRSLRAIHFSGSKVDRAKLFKTISPLEAESLRAAQANSGKRFVANKAEADPDFATVTLTVGDVWGDGTGYQMLLDANATAYGTIIPEAGALTSSGDASDEVYAEFEYKIPENADGSLTTSNIVLENSITIKIPEGIYDWVITNPTPGDRMWIAVEGRGDDFVFEKGHVYDFSVDLNGSNDLVTVLIDGEAPEVPEPESFTPPYSNDFSTIDLISQFSAIDANGDGDSWGYINDYLVISYASPNDDWLVSPAIQLVAGKKYHFSIDSWVESSTYPETFEVKAATEFSSAALAAGTVVLAEQTISNTANFTSTFPETYETYEFTVEADGYYYIGIHNTSNDEWYQYIDNFLIEAAPLMPDYTADFSTDAQLDDFLVIDNNGDDYTWNWTAANGAYYGYSSANAADDYLILPIKLEAGKNYNVTVTARAAAASFPEKFEVVAGKEPTVAGLSTTVIAETEVATTTNTDYTGTLSPEETGTYYVAIHATSEADMYQLRVSKFSIELGAESTAPAAVTDFTATAVENELAVDVAFTAPTKTIAGEELSALTKIEVLRDGDVVKTFDAPSVGGALSFKDEGLTAGTHKYQVIPYNEDGIGEKSEELSVKVTAAVDVPYTFNLTQDLTDLLTVIDNNNDGKTWSYSSSTGTYYSYSETNNADDYLVSLPVNLVAGKNYLVTVNARAYSDSYPEKFEVKVGKEATVAALTQTVIAETELTSKEAEDFEGQFSVAEDGQYYIAIHATSDADKYYLIVNSLSIELGAEPTAPAAIDDFTAEAGAEGALEVNLSFTAPAKAVNGTDLTGTEDIKIYRDGALVNTLTGVAVGSEQTWKDTGVENGKTYTYYVVAANATGDGPKSAKVSVFVGADELGSVQNFAAVGTTATTIDFAWDAVQGINGGYVDAANVTYSIYTLAIETDPYWGFQYLVADQKLTEVTGETAATVNYSVDEGELQYKYFGVSVKNATTEESDPADAYTSVVVGAPEELPILEGFADRTLHYAWNYSADADLMVSVEATDGDGVALNIISYTADSDQSFWLEKVNLKSAANPTLIFDVKSSDISSVDIIGSKDGAEFSVIATQAISSEYTTVKVPLTSIVGTRFSKVGISAHFENETVIDFWSGNIEELGDVLVIDNIKVVDLLEYNLGVEVSAPKTVNAGESAVIKAVVTNKGENAASDYKVTIKAGEEVLLEQTESEELGSFETKEISAELATSIFDEAGDVTITATVDFMEDLDMDDNTAEAVITIKESTAPTVSGVTAEETSEGVVVSWTAPDIEAGGTEVTETFDAGMGEFTSIDADGDGYDWVLGSECGGVYLVADASLAGTGHNDSADMMVSGSYSNVVGALTPDNYLVTPQAVLNGNFSFFACGQDADYAAEHFGVYVSTTGNTDPADFTKVQEWNMTASPAFFGGANNAPKRDQGSWYEYTVDLSSYAGQVGYVAIRHFNCTDQFMLDIDDVTYLVSGGAAPSSYNIYVDGELVATVTDGTEATIEGIVPGDHSIAVTAVYPNGQESKPVEVSITTDMGKIVINTNKPVDVYSIDGRLIRKQTTNFDGLKGAYIIDGRKVVIK